MPAPQGIKPADHGKQKFLSHLVHRFDIDIVQFQFIPGWKRFSEVQGVQNRFFGCCDVEIIDPDKSGKKDGGDF